MWIAFTFEPDRFVLGEMMSQLRLYETLEHAKRSETPEIEEWEPNWEWSDEDGAWLLDCCGQMTVVVEKTPEPEKTDGVSSG